MSDDRERRHSSTADGGYVVEGVPLNGVLDAEMERRAHECDERGHRWADPATRLFCTYCGSYWREEN
jgi:hypothetical protein